MSSKTKARKPQDHKSKKQVTAASSWKGKASGAGLETDLELPSGNVCRVKRVDMPTLLASGAFPDSLMSIVSEKVDTATGKSDKPKKLKKSEVEAVTQDPKKMVELFQSIDRLIPIVVAQPAVQNHNLIEKDAAGEQKVVRPLNEEERQALLDEYEGDLLFTDEVELEDKMFIFQFVIGGRRELETFRAELESSMGDVPAN